MRIDVYRRFVYMIILGMSALILMVPSVQAEALKDIAYAQADNDQQTLDIYRPDRAGENQPVVVYIHGGAWILGDKALSRQDISAYNDRGVILVSVNYRLAPKFKFPANISDIHTASHWVKDNIAAYGGDPENMVLVGHSAGGHLAALAGVGTEAHLPLALHYRGIVPVDTASYDITRANRSNLDRITRRSVVKTFGRHRKTLKAGSPLYQIDSQVSYNPFLLFVSSDRDNAVSGAHSFHQGLENSGQASTIHIIEGVSHKTMRELIFTPQSDIYTSILSLFN